MAKALVLITAEPGTDREVANRIKAIDGVQKVYLVAGLYDIVAEAETSDDASMLALVYDRLRAVEDIRETHSMFCLEV